MSLLTPERVAPRSAVRYRPIGTGQATSSGPVLTRKPPRRTDARSPSAQVVPDDLDLEEEEEHVPLRWHSVPPAPRRATAPPDRARVRVHPLLWLGVGLLVVVLLWIGVSQVIAWGTGVLNLIHYGIRISSDDRFDQFSPQRKAVTW